MAKGGKERFSDYPVSAVKAPTGRPSEYTDAIADAICEHVSNGGTLKSFCDKPGSPSRASVLRWLGRHESFRGAYASAREEQAHALVEKLLERAQSATNETAAGDRVAVDAMKWVASRVLARVYGDRVAMTGAEGGPIKTEETGDPVSLARKVAFVLAKGAAKMEDGTGG